MNKILTVFQRDPARMQLVTREVTPGCEWVFAGEGVPTRKLDGTNVRVTIAAGKVVLVEKRRNPSREEKAAGAEPGYVACMPGDPSDRWIGAAVQATVVSGWPDGAHPCEALGAKIQGGVEGPTPRLYPFMFDAAPFAEADGPRTFDSIRASLESCVCEGIVWHHPDGRMAKIKRRDFGLKWPVER